MFYLKKYKEVIACAFVLFVATVAHAYNMFHFPYYENDEGTYMSQAWSLITNGTLAPYTYWYDHAPLGWVLIAIWVKATGGFFTFGTSVDSGRVLMLILHIATAFLLYFVTKKVSNSTLASMIAVLIFSLSPLGIYFQRRVLLDNIMIFWVFLALALLLKKNLTLKTIFMSAIAFGIAVLTKENAIFFTPAFLYTLYKTVDKSHKELALIGWVFISASLVSFYFLYATFKGELLPPGLLDDTKEHVSLIATLQEQVKRGNSLPFWDRNSEFYINFISWQEKDQITILIGIVASIGLVIISLFKKVLRIPALFIVLFWLFLLRGKLVIDFYVIPLLPLLGMAIGIVYAFIARLVSFKNKYIYNAYALLGVAASIFIGAQSTSQFTKDETTPQREAISFIKKNIDPQSYIAIDDSMYVDLHAPRFVNDPVFPNADWVWKVEKDKEIYGKKLNYDWKNIEYITASHEIVKQIYQGNFPMIKNAMNFSYPLETWNKNSTAYVNMNNYISTNGDWFSVYKVKQDIDIILDGSWNFYKSNFIISYGQVVDPKREITTSEGQAYAMLRAVWRNDKSTFDGVWAWTKDHLQYRREDRLLSWKWGSKDGKEQVLDPASAADADTDTALALLFASRKWGNENYRTLAKEIIEDIWKQEIVEVNGRYYVLSGTNASRSNGYVVNPSYLSPGAYRIFAQVDPAHNWNKVANDSYLFLFEASQNGLPPNWIVVDNKTGKIKSAYPYVNDQNAGDFGYDAFRTMWRVALDVSWFKSSEGERYLNKISPLYEREIANGTLKDIYSVSGQPRSQFSSLATTSGALSTLSITNRKTAEKLYKEQFENVFTFEKGIWNDGTNYYDQNWAWFATALYFDKLPNLYDTTGINQN